MEIDTRIMGKITREQMTVRRQDEVKRDRLMANRKEEDLAIKEGILRFRETVFPRLAGFLLTNDVILRDAPPAKVDQPTEAPSPTSPTSPTATLAHPPRPRQPAALYYLPAKLTPAQEKFLAEQKAAATQAAAEEMKEWAVDRKKGLEEVAEFRKKAEAKKADLDALEDDSQGQRPPPVRGRSPSAAINEKMDTEKVGHTFIDEEVVPKEMDAEDTIEY